MLVLNVQNQYKDIARTIEKKKMKKILHYVRTDFIYSPCWRIKKCTKQGKKKRSVFFFILRVKRAAVAYFKGNRLYVFDALCGSICNNQSEPPAVFKMSFHSSLSTVKAATVRDVN